MNLPRFPAACAALLLGALSLTAQTAPAARVSSTGGHSPHETTSTVIGDRAHGNRITITYGRPFTKDPRTGEPRQIWGGLVPWDRPWRLGADEATLFITQKALQIDGNTLPAGVYTLYMIPSEHGDALLVFSTAVGQWGVPVDTGHDLVRAKPSRETVADHVDELTLGVAKDDSGHGGAIQVTWETTRFSVPFTVTP